LEDDSGGPSTGKDELVRLTSRVEPD
jgi:hypothetical protein